MKKVNTSIYKYILLGVVAFCILAISATTVPTSLLVKAARTGSEWISSSPSLVTPSYAFQGIADSESDVELEYVFGKWKPIQNAQNIRFIARIGERYFFTLKDAVKALDNGEILEIGEGVYEEPLIIRDSNVVVRGVGHVLFQNTAAKGKAAIINKGNNNVFENIECRHIKVKHKNGACIRNQGKNITLNHVYFHDSESGLMTGKRPGKVVITNSRFERLGKNGRAHGLYAGGGELEISNSMFLSSIDEGHEIKTRAHKTLIRNSVIASMSGNDSRLIDASNGGVLIVEHSILQQGSASENQDAIGYGLEGFKYGENSIRLESNLILLERKGRNVLVRIKGDKVDPLFHNNTIVSQKRIPLGGRNLQYKSRGQASLPEYPLLPLSRLD
ncbi:MAG: hypothetical protein ABW079_01955 [Sedimenticola sp.]